MCRNIIFVLMYHHHKLLDRIRQILPCLWKKVQWLIYGFEVVQLQRLCAKTSANKSDKIVKLHIKRHNQIFWLCHCSG
jgi:hypothetical protein